MYYTEIKLTFELQGPMCAFSQDETKWTGEKTSDTTYTFSTAQKHQSDLDYPIEAEFNLKLSQLTEPRTDSNRVLFIQLQLQYGKEDNTEIVPLFDCLLQNLPYDSNHTLHLKYTSEDGLLF